MKKDTLRVFRIASLILANAMLFQETLSQSNSGHQVEPLRVTLEQARKSSTLLVEKFLSQWKLIEDQINFIPIYSIARRVLRLLPADNVSEEMLSCLANAAIKISTKRAALRHDLMGRVFHRLLADAKYYGAFYTKIPAATLLMKLAMTEEIPNIDWTDRNSAGSLQVVDFACGTGTLLKASLRSILEKHLDESLRKGLSASHNHIHKQIVEDGLWGFDIVPSAVHMAATAVAMHNPDIALDRMKLYVLPLGTPFGPPKQLRYRLGSIEFVRERQLHVDTDLVGSFTGPRGALTDSGEMIDLPQFHLCTMNPPFTRSVYGNLLFGGIQQKKKRTQLQKELQRVRSEARLSANISAGLGSVFVAMADRFLKDGGVLALVLPKTVLIGSSWRPTRDLFGNYKLRYVIASHDPTDWGFSESTNLSEVLLVLQKGESKTATPTLFVNLWVQPNTGIESLSIANEITTNRAANLDQKSGITEIRIGTRKYGELSQISLSDHQIPWNIPVSFAQTDLCRSAFFLTKGNVLLPTHGIVGEIKMTKLSTLVDLGPDGRDVYDGFDLTLSKTAFHALWGYDSEKMSTLTSSPNQYLMALSKAKKGRSLRDAKDLWSKAGVLMLPKELRLTTSRVCAVVLDKPALSNVWWPTKPIPEAKSENHGLERRITLWLNSSLGILSLLMRRQETEGAWVKFPKAWYHDLDVLDFDSLTKKQVGIIDKAWELVYDKPFLRLPDIAKDETRAILDQAFARALGFKVTDLEELRDMLGREPALTMTRLVEHPPQVFPITSVSDSKERKEATILTLEDFIDEWDED